MCTSGSTSRLLAQAILGASGEKGGLRADSPQGHTAGKRCEPDVVLGHEGEEIVVQVGKTQVTVRHRHDANGTEPSLGTNFSRGRTGCLPKPGAARCGHALLD